MRKALAIALMGSLALGLLSSPALAGDPHAVRNRWAGVAIGAGAATLGGLLLGSLWAPPPAVAVSPVAYTPHPVVYAPPPVVKYRTWVPGHYENRWVSATERQHVRVEGHYENRWWVPGHWEERVRDGGNLARAWVDGYWR